MNDDVAEIAAARAVVSAIERALTPVSRGQPIDRWFCALAVYCGNSLGEARREHGMPDGTVRFMIKLMKQFALEEQ